MFIRSCLQIEFPKIEFYGSILCVIYFAVWTNIIIFFSWRTKSDYSFRCSAIILFLAFKSLSKIKWNTLRLLIVYTCSSVRINLKQVGNVDYLQSFYTKNEIKYIFFVNRFPASIVQELENMLYNIMYE